MTSASRLVTYISGACPIHKTLVPNFYLAMITKLKLELLAKVLPHVITDENNASIVHNIINGKRTSMSFQKAVLQSDVITGENLSGMVEDYEASQEAKKSEAAYYSDEN